MGTEGGAVEKESSDLGKLWIMMGLLENGKEYHKEGAVGKVAKPSQPEE